MVGEYKRSDSLAKEYPSVIEVYACIIPIGNILNTIIAIKPIFKNQKALFSFVLLQGLSE